MFYEEFPAHSLCMEKSEVTKEIDSKHLFRGKASCSCKVIFFKSLKQPVKEPTKLKSV